MFTCFFCSKENTTCDKNCTEAVKIFISIASLVATSLIAYFAYNLNSKTARFTCQNSIHKENISKIIEKNPIIVDDLNDYYTLSLESQEKKEKLLKEINANFESIKTNGNMIKRFCNKMTQELIDKNEVAIVDLLIGTDKNKSSEVLSNFKNLDTTVSHIEIYDFNTNCCEQ